ncbi:MAG: hypothetical protein ACWGQW_19265, partial [bacterium]
YGLPACTLGVRGTAHHNTWDSDGIFLAIEDFCRAFFLPNYQIKRAKGIPNPIQRNLEMSTDGFGISQRLILQILWMDGSYGEHKVSPENQAALVEDLQAA